MLCCVRKRKKEFKRPPKLVIKSSESLAENIKEYYRNSPGRNHKVLVIQKDTFFDEYGNSRKCYSSPERKIKRIKPTELL